MHIYLFVFILLLTFKGIKQTTNLTYLSEALIFLCTKFSNFVVELQKKLENYLTATATTVTPEKHAALTENHNWGGEGYFCVFLQKSAVLNRF